MIKDEAALASNAWLIYQKYLIPGAYIPVTSIPNNLVTDVQTVVQKHLDGLDNGTSQSPDIFVGIFDYIQNYLEDQLASELFGRFFKSKNYATYREKSAIHDIPITSHTKAEYAFQV